MSLRRSKHTAGADAIVSLFLAMIVASTLQTASGSGMGYVAVTMALTVFFLLVSYCWQLVRQDRKPPDEPEE